MGIIRKTASIATLGLVNWRSKSERLDIAEAEAEAANRKRTKVEASNERLSRRARRAEKKAEKAELMALHARKIADRERRRQLGSADSTLTAAADATVVGGRRAKRKAKRAAKRSKERMESLPGDVQDAISR